MISLDVSPIVALGTEDHNKDETLCIQALQPLKKNKKVLLHPIVNTYVMLKYNSYTLFFITILILKLLHCALLSGLVLRYQKSQIFYFFVFKFPCRALQLTKPDNSTDSTDSKLEDKNLFKDVLFTFLFISTFVFTLLIVLKEVAEMINQKLKWFSFLNIVQLLHVILIFVYQALLVVNVSNYEYLQAFIIFISWIDLTLSLQSLLFGKWSSLGLYITMLIEVDQEIKLAQFNIIFLDCEESCDFLHYLHPHAHWLHLHLHGSPA